MPKVPKKLRNKKKKRDTEKVEVTKPKRFKKKKATIKKEEEEEKVEPKPLATPVMLCPYCLDHMVLQSYIRGPEDHLHMYICKSCNSQGPTITTDNYRRCLKDLERLESKTKLIHRERP